jgi:hypothetical protein
MTIGPHAGTASCKIATERQASARPVFFMSCEREIAWGIRRSVCRALAPCALSVARDTGMVSRAQQRGCRRCEMRDTVPQVRLSSEESSEAALR